ncbi:MAG: hypothetical protein PVJ54_10330, partial [Desulfobacterales bacterium]
IESLAIHIAVNSLTLFFFKEHRLSFACEFGKRFITAGFRCRVSGVRVKNFMLSRIIRFSIGSLFSDT